MHDFLNFDMWNYPRIYSISVDGDFRYKMDGILL